MVGAEPEPRQQRPDLGVGRVATVGPELLLGPGVALDVALVWFLLRAAEAQLSMRRIASSRLAARQHVGDGAAAVEHSGDARVLGQVAELHP